MKIWDKQDRVWLERDGVDASDMLRLHGDRYSKTEMPADPVPELKVEAIASEAVQAAPVAPPPVRKKPSRKPRLLAALNGLAGKPAAPAQ